MGTTRFPWAGPEVCQGEAVTVVAYSRMTEEALWAATALEPHGISAEVIDLRTLSLSALARWRPRWSARGAWSSSGGWLTGGIGAEVVARVTERCFGYLQAPPRRVAAADVPVPASRVLEGRSLLTTAPSPAQWQRWSAY